MSGINCTDYGSYNRYIKQKLNTVTTPDAVRDSKGDTVSSNETAQNGIKAISHLGNRIDLMA